MRQFFKNLKRLIEWVPVIWNDRDWDYATIFPLLQYKLSRMRKEIVGQNRVQSAPKIGKQIRIAELLLERMGKDDYLGDEWSEYLAAYPIVFETTEDGYRKSVRQHDPERDRLGKSLRDREQYLRNQDEEYLVKHLRKHMKKWWD